MFRCAHVQWLDIDQAESRWTLTDPDRLRSITKELPNAEQQYPSLVFFIGKRVKTVALRDIYTSNNVTRRRAHGLANLLVDVKTYTSDRPIIFADCTPGAPCTSLLGPWGACHENHRHTICENSSQLEDMVTLTHVNLFFPFTHVVCIFADDLGGNRACARYIEGLTRRRAEPPVSCTEACPHLLVVTTGSDALDDLVQVECHDGFHSVFESFQILTLDEGTASSSEKLKTTLQHVIDDARQLRRERHLLFTAVQLAKVFARASETFSQEPVKPVNLLAAAQHPAQSLSAEHVAHHIKHFLSLSAQHLSRSAIVEHIASALIVQGYPSGIHRFSSQLVFETFFVPVLTVIAAAQTLTTEIVWQRFSFLFDGLATNHTTHNLRRQVLLKHKSSGAHLETKNLCLWCLIQPPERTLRCGHSVCEECLSQYYAPGHGTYTYVVDRCLVCGIDTAVVLKVKGPTVMPSLLGFDGGGVRGIVAIILAMRLEDVLDVPYPFWEFFHSVVGTSVGGVIALDLVVCRSSISQSLARFKHWVTRIFPIKRYRCLPYYQKLRDCLLWLIRDSKYDSQVLEAVMQEAFGKNELLFDATAQHWSGTKLGIMATTASTSQLRIFTNYNGSNHHKHDKGYRILRPTKVCDEPFVCEAAQVTAAAPWYFLPKDVRGFEAMHDGGMRANNPIEAGLWELGSIWPGHTRPGLVVSVGTGFQDSPIHELDGDRGIWYDRFALRIFRAFLSSPCLHGQNSWKALLNRVEEHSRDDFLRLNLEFVGKESALDDTEEISYLCQLAMEYKVDFKAYRDPIWASAFFYELVEEPQLFRGYFTCRGMIYCKFNDARPLLQAIRRAYLQPKIMIDDNVVADFGADRDYCSGCGLFQQRTQFEVRDLTTSVNLTLAFERGRRRHISSFPNTLQWIVDKQSKHGQFKSWHTVAKCSCCGSGHKRNASWDTDRPSKRRRAI